MDSPIISSPWGLFVKVFKVVFLIDRSEQRISRGQYWIATAMLSLLYSLVMMLLSFVDGVFITALIGTIVRVFIATAWLLLFKRRLHDLNMSVWRITPLIILYLSFVGLILFSVFLFKSSGGLDLSIISDFFSSEYGTILIVFYAITALIAFGISFRLSFYKSVNENNRFGPDPLRNITVTNSSYRLMVIILVIVGSVVSSLSKEGYEQYLQEIESNEETGLLLEEDIREILIDTEEKSEMSGEQQADLQGE